MTTFISIQGSYTKLEIVLIQNNRCIQTVVMEHVKASSHLIPYLENLLTNHSITLSDLDFICVDKGPGAFTSLRVTIATVNGLSFARKIPLVGIDGLEALFKQTKGKLGNLKPTHIVCLLNAYNNDVYYLARSLQTNKTKKGCANIDAVLEKLSINFFNENYLLVGNAVEMHMPAIKNVLGEYFCILSEIDMVASAQQIGIMGYALWQKDPERFKNCFEISPNYMKTQTFAVKK